MPDPDACDGGFTGRGLGLFFVIVLVSALALTTTGLVSIDRAQARPTEAAARPHTRSIAKRPARSIFISSVGPRVVVRVTGPKHYSTKIAGSKLLRNLRTGTYRISVVKTPLLNSKLSRTSVKVTRATRAIVRITTTAKAPAPAVQPHPTISFHLALAKAVAVQGAPTLPFARTRGVDARSGPEGGGLLAVNEDGSTEPAVTDATARVNHTYVSPAGELYVEFSSPQTLPDGTQCVLARVLKSTGSSTCVDPAILSLDHSPNYGEKAANAPVQFDASGTVYYRARFVQASVATELRSNSEGVLHTIFAPVGSQSLFDYLTLSNGDVLITGTTGAGSWVRRVTPGNAVSTVTLSSAFFMRLFPDGNVYMGTGQAGYEVWRYLTATHTLDPRPWIGSNAVIIDGQQTWPYNQKSTFCAGQTPPALYAFCNTSPGYMQGQSVVNGGSLFAAARQDSLDSGPTLIQYFPELRPVTSSIESISTSESVLGNVIVAGRNRNGVNMLTILNPGAGTESVILDGSSELEVANVKYLPGTDKVLFDGLRFADNRHVVGVFDVATHSLTITPTGMNVSWDELQVL